MDALTELRLPMVRNPENTNDPEPVDAASDSNRGFRIFFQGSSSLKREVMAGLAKINDLSAENKAMQRELFCINVAINSSDQAGKIKDRSFRITNVLYMAAQGSLVKV